jgi:hypothetical protein
MKKLIIVTALVLGFVWVSFHTNAGDKIWIKSNPFKLTRMIVSLVT